ncbi:Hcp family type VI secretion system effector [Novosphingobium rosa]|uniref:Hcp family type VI secretion system effector n=1 Tax=Novosphingobium rosa TaxID=76978 RepID=UPI000836453B|nr:type VI secretion system tube protein Hcp [Novosphingobium rosa]
MAVDLFLKIDGIDGESQKKGHEKEIDIISFNFGAAQHGSFHTGGAGGGSGKAEIRDISITKEVDKSSAKLFSACASGRHIPQVIIYSQKAGDGTNPLVYYKITLEDVIVSSVDNQGASHGDAIMESVVFNTAKVTFDYQPQNRSGGKDGGVITASYDIRQNVAS